MHHDQLVMVAPSSSRLRVSVWMIVVSGVVVML